MRTAVLIVFLILGASSRGAEPSFPEFRASLVRLPGQWSASPIAAVGEVVNSRKYADQTVTKLPAPMSPDVRRLYWCIGDFISKGVVKGNLRTPTPKYLWASSRPGCGVPKSGERYRTKVWFLREEGGFLRPTFDIDPVAGRFLGLFPTWQPSPDLAAREHLGALLMTPSANSGSLQDYANYLWDVGDIACDLLGKQECMRQLRALAALGEATLRDAACGFLKGQLEQNCKPE